MYMQVGELAYGVPAGVRDELVAFAVDVDPCLSCKHLRDLDDVFPEFAIARPEIVNRLDVQAGHKQSVHTGFWLGARYSHD